MSREEAIKLLKDETKTKEFWFCPKCNIEIHPAQVTNTGHCEKCGTFLDYNIIDKNNILKAIDLLESKLDSTDFTKFRQQIGKALNMKGLLDEDIPPTEFILAEIDRLTAENKELNTEREWWENLTRKGNIGTKDVPSLHDYIVKLQAELKTTKDELKYCQRLLDIESRP